MSRPIHRLALAAALLCAGPMLSSRADAAPPERPNKPSMIEDGPAIFLGTVSADGAWLRCNVEPAPVVVVGDPARLLEDLQTVKLTSGAKVHQAPRQSATVISRHKAGTKLRLVGMHISGAGDTFYVWGLIDRGRASYSSHPDPYQLAARPSAVDRNRLHVQLRRQT